MAASKTTESGVPLHTQMDDMTTNPQKIVKLRLKYPREEERQVADDSDRETLLGHDTIPYFRSATWMHESIIAERKAEEGKKNGEYLVMPMPVWRREGIGFAVDRGLLDDWNSLKGRDDTIEVANGENGKAIVHRYHPLLNRHNDVENNQRRYQELDASDTRDRQEALEMLGHILKHAMNNNERMPQFITDAIGGRIFDGILVNKPASLTA